MKMNIKGLVFVGFAAAVFASAANADVPTGTTGAKTVTSVNYTEATYQKKIGGTDGQLVKSTGSEGTVGFVNVGNDNTYIDTTAGNGVVVTGKAVAEALANNGGTVNNNTITIKSENNEWSDSFTTNNSSDKNIVIPVMDGTNGTAAGKEGLVPAPTTADQNKVLSGAGTWVEQTAAANNNTITIKSENNEWSDSFTTNNASNKDIVIPVMDGTNGSVAGKEGLVPAPTTADQNKVLSGAGNWVEQTAAANDATITIYKSDGITSVGSFTVNQSSAGTITLPVDSDTTYTADDITVEIDTNNQIKAKTATITGSTSQNTLTTGGQVAEYVATMIPTPDANTCTASAPCALVMAGGTTPVWQAIQQ